MALEGTYSITAVVHPESKRTSLRMDISINIRIKRLMLSRPVLVNAAHSARMVVNRRQEASHRSRCHSMHPTS
jgi:hypothetical protein